MTEGNDVAYGQMLAHHRELVENVSRRVAALEATVAESASFEEVKVDLLTYVVDEVLPHALAEELTVYASAARREAASATVEQMVAEHRTLAIEVEGLARATSGADALAHAVAFFDLFDAHVTRENDVLLAPMVDDDEVDLAALLSSMAQLIHNRSDDAVRLRVERADHEALVVRHLIDATLVLARAGEAERACSLAARAWAALRLARPDLADEVNRAMHRLVRISGASSASVTAGESSEDRVLDVRPLVPRQRHETIFHTFEDLRAGTGFLLVNDHDPRPLRYQFEAEHPGEFTWDYLESGPRVWRVRVGRVG
jgi:uncharacterized protein (DUF2249 family)